MFRAVRLLPALIFLALPVQAAVFTVTKTFDTLDGACDHDCSLREAVSAANADDEPGKGADVVVVPAGIYQLERLGAGEDLNATGDLDLLDEIILVGAGAGSTVLDGWGFDRVLDVRFRTEIFGVTIRNGRVEGDGGGMLAWDAVFLRRSVVSGNLAQNGGDGGGIAVVGELEVRESAILDNHAEGEGGGISAVGQEGFVSLFNVTVSGNRANGSGGGLDYTAGHAAVWSSTLVFNQADVSGGGVNARFPLIPGTKPTEYFSGSIVAENVAPEEPDCSRYTASSGYNVIGVACNLEPTDRSGTAESPLRAVFRVPRNDLGPTPVHTLLLGSPALDLVPASHCQAADQVGQARTAPCDAGAWEKVDRPVCVPGGPILCLQDGRFRVSAAWVVDERLSGNPAQGVPLTDDTGNFWFFGPQNLEVMVKVLDGCSLNQRWWVFSSGLTDVGVVLRVEDLATGRIWENVHRKGSTYAPRLDTSAFPCELPAASSVDSTGAAADGSPVGPAPPPSVLVVTKTEDTNDGACDHDCSLREAVLRANLWDTGVIVLGPGVYTLGIEGRGEEAAHTGDLDATGDLVVLGAGATRTVIDGGGIDRVLDVRSTGSLELYDVTVRNGRARPYPFHAGVGGGILSSGPLTLVRSRITANHAEDQGGGLFAFELKARDSTVSGNVAETAGGGLVTVFADLENVTVSGNQAGNQAGGVLLYLFGASFRNVTITGNSASIGGGMAVNIDDCLPFSCHEVFDLNRTVIAGNVSGIVNSPHSDCWGMLPRGGAHNLFGIGNECSPGPDDLAGTAAQPLDPRLSPLGDHGGPTPTHVPLPDSPAVDLPSASCPGADQRGRPRPADGDLDGTAHCDAGAVERLPACQPDEHTLCLGAGDRFRITARWTVFPESGSARSVPLALDTGAFWFFAADNLELTVKVLDGCGLNQRFWVFLSGLTDVGVEVSVEDTATGNTWTHSHAAGTPLQPRLDTDALESCP
jgi:CSLREA domain-containing protein